MKNSSESKLNITFISAGIIAIAFGFFLYSKKTPTVQSGTDTSEESAQSVTHLEFPDKFQASNDSVADSPTPTVEPSPSEMTLADFAELTQKVQVALPTRQNLKGLTNDQVHHVPEVILKAGDDLGSIAQALHDNPHFAAEGARFYNDCFSRKDLPPQIRALCLANHRNLRKANGDQAPWTEQELKAPKEVRRLADQIPTI